MEEKERLNNINNQLEELYKRLYVINKVSGGAKNLEDAEIIIQDIQGKVNALFIMLKG